MRITDSIFSVFILAGEADARFANLAKKQADSSRNLC
jgi:hypothetical protein